MEYAWRQITVVVLFNCSILVTTTSQHRPLGKAEKSCKKTPVTRAAVFYEVCTLFMHFFMGSSPFLFAALPFFFYFFPTVAQCRAMQQGAHSVSPGRYIPVQAQGGRHTTALAQQHRYSRGEQLYTFILWVIEERSSTLKVVAGLCKTPLNCGWHRVNWICTFTPSVVQTKDFIEVDQPPGFGTTFRDTGGYQKAGTTFKKIIHLVTLSLKCMYTTEVETKLRRRAPPSVKAIFLQ